MRKFSFLLLIFLGISLNFIDVIPIFAHTVLKEGVYKVSDLALPSKAEYECQNVSPTDKVLVDIIDDNHETILSSELMPNSPKYKLPPMKPDYRIVVVGKGLISIE